MKMRESVIVVNSKTYEAMRENAMATASLQSDPINYLAQWSELQFVIDESTPDNVSEVWYKDVYDFHKELERIKNEQVGDKDGMG